MFLIPERGRLRRLTCVLECRAYIDLTGRVTGVAAGENI